MDRKDSDLSFYVKEDIPEPKLNERSVSFLDMVENTLTHEDYIVGGDEDYGSSDEDVREEEDIGDIAFDIATEAVDEISKVKKRLGTQIGAFKQERDMIMKKVSPHRIREFCVRF